ncbi:hypothetical protein AB0M12_37795 [Nocardia vinacea]|uniref:hypothetical protein n=1 Tax=Nocardia vinacea TaxID=96468 RepID=UPI00341BD47A
MSDGFGAGPEVSQVGGDHRDGLIPMGGGDYQRGGHAGLDIDGQYLGEDVAAFAGEVADELFVGER